MQPAAPPAIRIPAAPRDGAESAAWLERHEHFVARARQGGIDVLFLGDSITDLFPVRGRHTWERRILPLGRVANFGISGDRTHHLLWRVRNGELDGSGARVVVLLIGTNDLAFETPAGIARGIVAIVETIRAKLPRAAVVLNAVLPRGAPDDALRANAADVNRRIAPLARGGRVLWVDAGPAFLDAGGRIPPELMPDGLHPAGAGYDAWAAALRPVLVRALATEAQP